MTIPKRKLLLFSIFALCVFLLSACFNTETEESATPEADISFKQHTGSDFDDPSLANEDDGATPISIARDEKAFYGTWQTISEYAEYIIGNASLKINEDGTWKGNITEEDYSGKWIYDGLGITIKDREGFIHWQLFYTTDGTMMFKDLDDPAVQLVLKPKR